MNELGRILQVGGHQHAGIARDECEACGEAAVHPEVARQLEQLEPLVVLADLEQLLPGVVLRAVLDDDDLEVVGGLGIHHRGQPARQLVDAFALVVGGRDDAHELPAGARLGRLGWRDAGHAAPSRPRYHATVSSSPSATEIRGLQPSSVFALAAERYWSRISCSAWPRISGSTCEPTAASQTRS